MLEHLNYNLNYNGCLNYNLNISDRIVRNSESCGVVKIGDCTVQRQLFADDLMLLDSTQTGLQLALDRFSDACSVAGMKISTTKTALGGAVALGSAVTVWY